MKSVKYLDDVMKANNLKNDAELARYMEWPTSKISQYRTGKRTMDNEACLAVAMKLGIDPVPIIMAADIDRAERAGQHSLWEVFMQRTSIAASVLAVVSVNLFLTPENAQAAPRLVSQTVQAPNQFVLCQISRKLRAVFAAIKRWLFGPALQPATP